MKESEEFCPRNQEEWREWLDINHERTDAIWLVFYRKNSPQFNLSWSESVDVALCYGWIDSTKRAIDNEKYKQYFTRRKAKSNWSKINKDKISHLIQLGVMKEAGLKSIQVAKENGSWSFLDQVQNLEIPDDLSQALLQKNGAQAYFDGLSNSDKKILLYWIVSAKRKETRLKRIIEVVNNASLQLKPKQFR